MPLPHEATYFNEAITPSTVNWVNTACHGHDINGLDSHGPGNDLDITESSQEIPFQPIAICGMACRLPGGISSPEQLWDFIIKKKDARQRVPKSRYNVDAYYSAREKPGSVRTEYGYFLDGDLAGYDGSFFSMSPMELQRCDPQQRLMLEVAHECVEEAGEKSLAGKKVGVFVGNFAEDWNDMLENDVQQHGVYRIVGSGDFALANRVSYELNLQGPSMTVRTACSSALVGLNEACIAIAHGDCQSAIVGGASIILTPSMTIRFTEQGVLSKEGSCKTFSADADGYARAEAVNAVYIKPLSDALRDGNPVRAVIRGTAANHNGKTPGISYPGAKSQEALIRRTYQIAGIQNYAETGFVECHGTGTLVGDPIETTAIANIFCNTNQSDGDIFIGSIKPNLGHGEGASGLTSLLKAVLALQKRTIPPNIKFTQPNPHIPWETGLTVPTDAVPWPLGKKERISVNSFGIGGANAHVIIDSAAAHGVQTELEEANDNPHLLVFSAKSPDSLQALIENYSTYLSEYPERLTDLAFTLANKRAHYPHRAFLLASREQPGKPSPSVKPMNSPPNVIMVFTGQGAQWPQMGRHLLRQNATFKSSIKTLDRLLQSLESNRPDWTIEGELRKPARTSRLDQAEISQPVSTAIQIALADCFSELDITPSAVVGHSSGEIAGAYASGALTKKEAITAAYHRGVVAKLQNRQGAMAVIGMSWKDVKEYLKLASNVSVACENSARSVTISGDADQVEQIVSKIHEAEPGVLARRLKVEKAYHSYHMKEIGDHYHTLISDSKRNSSTERALGSQPKTLFFSSVTGQLYNGELGTRYWQDNLESPVLFRDAVASLLAHSVGQNAIFLEVGPHSALAGPLRQTQAEFNNRNEYIPAMVRGQNSTESFLAAIGKLYTVHATVDFATLYPHGVCLTDLPRYSWNRDTSYWHETRVTEEWRHRKHPHHNLLGVKVTESSELEPVWRNVFHLQNSPWVRDHRLGEDIVFPFSAYVGMAAEAVRQISGVERGVTLRNTTVTVALIVTDERPTELITSLRMKLPKISNSEEKWWEFTISSYSTQTGSWTSHCSGEATAAVDAIGLKSELFLSPLHRTVESEKWFQVVHHGGMNYGPSFQRWAGMRTSTVKPARATAHMANTRIGDEDQYHLHPTIVDGAFQLLVVGASLGLGVKYRNNLAVGVGELTLLRTTNGMKAGVVANIDSRGNISGQGHCVTSNGQVVLNMKGMRLSAFEEPMPADRHAAARLIWQPHVDFEAMNKMVKPAVNLSEDLPVLEELFELALLYSSDAVSGACPTLPHLQKYHAWLKRQSESLPSQLNKYHGFTADVLQRKMSDHTARLANSPIIGAALAISAVARAMGGILTGTLNGLEVLDQDDILTRLEKIIHEYDVSGLLKAFGHKKPNIRVLELGAGMGLKTENHLVDLGPLCSKYTFSDTTNRLFETVKNRVESASKLEFLVFDIQRPLEEQGLEGREFDLIIANNVLHQTDDLSFSLANVHKLLHPDGRLLLHEIMPSSSSQWINYVMGSLPSWWHGCGADGRSAEPCMDWDGWDSELRTAGFDVLNEAAHVPVQHLTATIVAKRLRTAPISRSVGLLVADDANYTRGIQSALEKHGYTVTRFTIDQDPPVGQDIISLLDHDAPFLGDLTDKRFRDLQKLVFGLSGGAGVFWITRPSSLESRDPSFSQVLGFSRVVRSELDLDFAVCETIPEWQSAADTTARVLDVFEKFHLRSRRDEDLLPDMEYAVKDDTVYVGRFYPFELARELQTAQPEIDRVALVPGRPGRLAELNWRYQECEKLAEGEVEIEVDTAGVGARDISVASQGDASELSSFGIAAAGVVLNTGSAVDKYVQGERVLCRAQGALSTKIIVPQQLVTKLPDNLNSAEAVGFADVYTTAYCSLFIVGGLDPQKAVLIHDGASPIGLAAIQLACAKGNEVYTTIGRAEERLLIGSMNIPHLSEDRILDLKSLTALRASGKGFELAIVQNAVGIPEESINAIWDSISVFGKLVDLNIGIDDTTTLGGSSLPNRSYCNLNMEHVQSLRPDIISCILRDIVGLYEDGLIRPLLSTKVFPADKVADAFKYAADQATPCENIVIRLKESDGKSAISEATVGSRRRNPIFDPAASYLLVGGLGGLGRSVAIWMAEHGARHLVFMSRSAGSRDEDHQFAEELLSMGCKPRLIAGDVCKVLDVRRAVDVCVAAGPLRGVYQMSMVLRDQSFDRMSMADWNAVVRPKVDGTWNLHNETISRETVKLDFFVLFSSISGLIGQPGQANYASANTFLDAFVEYRREMGLPASAVQIGPVEDTGVVAANPELLGQFRASGFHLLREGEILDSIEVATTVVKHETRIGNFVIGLRASSPLTSPGNRLVWRRDPRMAIYHNSGSKAEGLSGGGSNDGLKSLLASARENPSFLATSEAAELMASEIGREVMTLLMKPADEEINMDLGLAALGMDSLVGIELRQWLKGKLGLDMTVVQMMSMGTLGLLGKAAAEGLAKQYALRVS